MGVRGFCRNGYQMAWLALNKDNVKNLRVVWRWKADNSGRGRKTTSKQRR